MNKEQFRVNERNNVKEQLRAYLTRTGSTQSEVAKRIGTSSALISSYLSGSYKGDINKLEKILQEFLKREEERAYEKREHIFVPTKQANDVLAVLTYAHLYRTIGVVYGSAGLGKSESIKEYKKQNTQMIHIVCSPVLNNAAILEEILEKMGKVATGGKRKMFKAVIETLYGTDMLVVFDEAQHLNYKAIETIRTIHDIAKVGVVFVGTVEVYDRMTGRRNLKYDQIFSRVGIRRYLRPEIKRKEVKELVMKNFPNTEEKGINFLYARAQEAGALRKIFMMLRMARNIAKSNGNVITEDILKESEKLLWGRI